MTDAPKLAPPGAGIPWHQRMALRYYYKPFVAARSDWQENWDKFDNYNHKILSVAEELEAAQLEKRVLIPSMPALEDSSRYWSVAMTMEHLVIVGSGVVSVIRQLGNGTVPPHEVGTAEVKPHGRQSGAESLAAFRTFAQSARKEIESRVLMPIDQTLRYKHPWMRDIDALQWQWMIGAHTALHYRQICEITKGLRA